MLMNAGLCMSLLLYDASAVDVEFSLQNSSVLGETRNEKDPQPPVSCLPKPYALELKLITFDL